MFFSILLLTALAAVPATRAEIFHVTVGGPGVLKFDPESINANPGDLVRFTFRQKNHTVTQSSLASPCSPLEGGFDSGFVPVGTDAVDFPIAELEISDTEPIWAYCRQGNHCAQGMVFAVNPGDKMDQFRSAATGSTDAASASAAPSTSDAVSTSIVPSATVTSTQYSTAAAPASTGTNHKIVVGGPGQLLFSPSNITANPGDTVTFEFRQKSHSVTQSSFGNPCVQLQGGFDSGFMPVADDVTSNFPTYTLNINDTNVIWGYCRQATHCQQGMVFSINANEDSDKSFAAFKAAAMSASTDTVSSTGNNTNNNSALPLNRISNGAGIVLTVVGLLFSSFLV